MATGFIPAGQDSPLGILRYLTHLVVEQNVNYAEIITGFEQENSYQIRAITGEILMVASERSGYCGRMFCGNSRAFDMFITDMAGQQVIRIERLLKFCGCHNQQLNVYGPQNEFIGSIQERCTLFCNEFHIIDAQGFLLAQVKGPCCKFRYSDVNFPIMSTDNYQIGLITKIFRVQNIMREVFTDADTFAVSFDADLTKELKALILSMTFLIDFMFFEGKHERKDDNNRRSQITY